MLGDSEKQRRRQTQRDLGIRKITKGAKGLLHRTSRNSGSGGEQPALSSPSINYLSAERSALVDLEGVPPQGVIGQIIDII